MEEILKKRIGYKMSVIANPMNGDEFFNILYSLDWESEHFVTVEKLRYLTCTKLGPERYVKFLNAFRVLQIYKQEQKRIKNTNVSAKHLC